LGNVTGGGIQDVWSNATGKPSDGFNVTLRFRWYDLRDVLGGQSPASPEPVSAELEYFMKHNYVNLQKSGVC
jgi:hypothetical protein